VQHFIGLDVHRDSTTLVCVDAAGKRRKSAVLPTEARALIAALPSIRRPRSVCLEEGTHSTWLHEVLGPHVDELVVTAVTESRKGPKSDHHDALALAQALRLGDVHPVFKGLGAFRRLRSLCRAYQQVRSDLIRTKGRLKAIYRARGVQTEGNRVTTGSGRHQYCDQLPLEDRDAAALLYLELDGQTSLKEEAQRLLVEESHRHAISRIVETAPGLGPVRVAQLLPIVVTPHRFRTRGQFWSYCGLGIEMRSSADWVQAPDGRWQRRRVATTRGLSRTFNRHLQSIFKDAALAVVAKKMTPLYQDYERITQGGTKPPLARLTLARRIAATTLAMWKNQEVYDPTRTQTPA
jgi:transposase